MGEENLLPCPFCGGNNLALTQPCAGAGWGVLCRDCHVNKDSRCAAQADAIAAWNTRATADDGWQPIETAPKDGTEFQSWCIRPEGPDEKGWWEPKARVNLDSGAFELWGRTDYDQDGWDTYIHVRLTHWRPLPAPPSSEPPHVG